MFSPRIVCGPCERANQTAAWVVQYEAGASIYDLERQTGFSASYIGRRLRAAGCKMRRRGPPSGSLDDAAAQRMMDAGADDLAIGNAFGVSDAAVRAAVHLGRLVRPAGWKRRQRKAAAP